MRTAEFEIKRTYSNLNEGFWDRLSQSVKDKATATKALFSNKAYTQLIIRTQAKHIGDSVMNALENNASQENVKVRDKQKPVGGSSPEDCIMLYPKVFIRLLASFNDGAFGNSRATEVIKKINDPMFAALNNNLKTNQPVPLSDKQFVSFCEKAARFLIDRGWMDIVSIIELLPASQQERFKDAIKGLITKNQQHSEEKHNQVDEFYSWLQEQSIIDDALEPGEIDISPKLWGEYLENLFESLFNVEPIAKFIQEYLNKTPIYTNNAASGDDISNMLKQTKIWMTNNWLLDKGQPRDFSKLLSHTSSTIVSWLNSNNFIVNGQLDEAALSSAGFSDVEIEIFKSMV
jgi:hypothetical protein